MKKYYTEVFTGVCDYLEEHPVLLRYDFHDEPYNEDYQDMVPEEWNNYDADFPFRYRLGIFKHNGVDYLYFFNKRNPDNQYSSFDEPVEPGDPKYNWSEFTDEDGNTILLPAIEVNGELKPHLPKYDEYDVEFFAKEMEYEEMEELGWLDD